MNNSSVNEIKIDWDMIDDVLSVETESNLPENAITSELLAEKYGVSIGSGRRKLRELLASGKFDVFRAAVPETGGQRKYLLPKEEK